MKIDKLNVERDCDALIWADNLEAGDTLFKNVPVGGKFRFASSSEVLTRTKTGHKNPIGKTFKTGQRTAVFLILPELKLSR